MSGRARSLKLTTKKSPPRLLTMNYFTEVVSTISIRKQREIPLVAVTTTQLAALLLMNIRIMAVARANAIDAARAVNDLLRLDSSDQEALLEVLGDYFCRPSNSVESSDEESESESELDPTKGANKSWNPHCGCITIHFEGSMIQ